MWNQSVFLGSDLLYTYTGGALIDYYLKMKGDNLPCPYEYQEHKKNSSKILLHVLIRILSDCLPKYMYNVPECQNV